MESAEELASPSTGWLWQPGRALTFSGTAAIIHLWEMPTGASLKVGDGSIGLSQRLATG